MRTSDYLRSFRPVVAALALLVAAFGPSTSLAQGEVTLWSLHANRALAHLDQGGLVLDGGSAGFVRYTRGNSGGKGWNVDQRLDGERVTLLPGRQGTLTLPLSARQATARRVELRVKALAAGQRVTLFVNEQNLGDLEVATGWQTLAKEIPAGLLRAGENQLRLTFRKSGTVAGVKSAAALRWLRLALPDAAALPESGPQLLLASGASALALAPGGGLAYYLLPPRGSHLRLRAVPAAGSAGCSLTTTLTFEGRPPRVASTLAVPAAAELDVDLAASGDQPLRLELQEVGGGACQGLTLESPRLVAAVQTPALPASGAKPQHVIFVLVDTLRADRLTVYNPKTRVKTPAIDALAKESTVFMRHMVEGTESKVSHATLFTGVWPAVHRVLTEKAKVPDKLTTIAEAMRSGGRNTAAFLSNGYVSEAWNYMQGFQTTRNFIREGGQNDASIVINTGKKWLDANATKGPFYLYLGTIDCHVTYRSHDGLIQQYDPTPYNGPFQKYLSGDEMGRIKAGSLKITPRDKVRIEALYDNNVAYTDRWVGDLLTYLRTKGLLEQTLIVLTGDHGDEFWEHGSSGHANGLHQEMVGVPLILRYPGIFPAGARVEVESGGVDLLPTLLEALGLPIPAEVQGESLIPWVRGARPVYPRATLATHYEQVHALRLGDLKLIVGGKTLLYDLGADPREATNLKDKRPITLRTLQDPLYLFLSQRARWKKRTWGSPSNLLPGFTSELQIP